MIRCEGNIVQYEGEAKDVCKEFTYLTMGFVDVLEKEYGLTKEESVRIVVECANIAVSDEETRKQLLDKYDEYNNEYLS